MFRDCWSLFGDRWLFLEIVGHGLRPVDEVCHFGGVREMLQVVRHCSRFGVMLKDIWLCFEDCWPKKSVIFFFPIFLLTPAPKLAVYLETHDSVPFYFVATTKFTYFFRSFCSYLRFFLTP